MLPGTNDGKIRGQEACLECGGIWNDDTVPGVGPWVRVAGMSRGGKVAFLTIETHGIEQDLGEQQTVSHD